MKEVDDITLPYCKLVDDYIDPVNHTSLSANFANFFLEVASLLNSHV